MNAPSFFLGMVFGALVGFVCNYLTETDTRQVYQMTQSQAKVRIVARYENEDAFWVQMCAGGTVFALQRDEFEPTNDTCR